MTANPEVDVRTAPKAIGFNDMLVWLYDIMMAILPKIAISAAIIIVTFIILRLLRATVKRMLMGYLERREDSPRDVAQRAQTLASVIESGIRFFVVVLATLMVLTNLGLDIGPLIASAGIAGLAIGLGAQNLIRDMINGFVILLESQYAVGDVVVIGAVTGTVEDLNLRRTLLRADNGAAIVIPNSLVTIVQNQSKDWSRAILDINIAPDTDDDHMMTVLRDELETVQEDAFLGPKITAHPTIVGLTNVSATQLTYRVTVRTQPLEQWDVERELRRRIYNRLLREGIHVV